MKFNFTYKSKTLLFSSIIATMAFNTQSQAVESTHWQQFKNAKASGSEPTLPDFSYAGYAYSEKPVIDTSNWKVFDVGSPTAQNWDDQIIKDAISDAEAYIDTLSASAIKNGTAGAIVKFRAGTYKVAPQEGIVPEQQILIQRSNIVLQGAGNNETTGTKIHVINHMARDVYCNKDGGTDHCYGIPMFQFITPSDQRSTPVLTRLASNAQRETFELEVESSSSLSVGQTITLKATGTDILYDQLDGEVLRPEWTSTESGGMAVREIHTIKSIKGNKITLNAPIHITLKQSYDVEIRAITMLHNVGVEKIHFEGEWDNYPDTFVHHHSTDLVHDYGWTALNMERVHNAWIDRVNFEHFNQNLSFRTSSAITVSNVKFQGKQGHASVGISESFHVLVKDSQDTAGHHHGIGIMQRAAGNVYLRYSMDGDQRIDFHAAGPYASLHDGITGGHFWGNGGSTSVKPHHLNHYVAWNFNVNGGPDNYDFWPSGSTGHTNVFLKPYFIGLHGKNVDLEPGTFAINESQGSKVEPESLFEAQVGLRHLPGYIYYGTEGGTANFSEKVDVAFGVDGKYNHIYNVQGNVALNNTTFGGDPVPGKKKVVYYRPSAPSGYTYDVKENQTVLVPTLRNVAFGANGNFVYKYNQTADLTCERASFNNQDPAPGVVKNCFVQLLNTPQGYDDYIRNEKQTVNVSQPVNIAYGANGKFIFKYNVTSNLTCGNDAFGSDPIPGVAKKCYVRIR